MILRILGGGKIGNQEFYVTENELPDVSVIMSLYNEEKVIKEKLERLQALAYPKEKIKMYIGSDCSSDRTNEIVQAFAEADNRIQFFPFKERRGKPGVVNDIADAALNERGNRADHIFLVTDANVMPEPSTLKNLIRHFKNEEITLVDSNMVNIGMKKEGISKSEKQYVSNEVQMKNWEGKIWKKMIGPFGGFYVIRSNYFSKVPPRYLVDDFYITMRLFEKNGNAINDLDAICYEAVSHDMSEEYKRKARISAGNFQNLKTFKRLLWPFWKGLGFAFLSHKVLRWLGPFFLILLSISGILLAIFSTLFYTLFFALIGMLLIGIPILDAILKRINVNIFLFRSVTYFNMMNVALFQGFINYLKGITTNVWQPPKRN